MNYIMVEGRLGSDPETKSVGDNTLVTGRLAVRRYDPKAEGKFATDWYSLACWGTKGAAGVLPKMGKGESVVIFGRIELKEWVTREGDEKIDPSIFVMDAIPKKWLGEDERSEPRSSAAPKKSDDLPF